MLIYVALIYAALIYVTLIYVALIYMALTWRYQGGRIFFAPNNIKHNL